MIISIQILLWIHLSWIRGMVKWLMYGSQAWRIFFPNI